MRIFWLSISNLVSRPLRTLLSILLLALGVGMISLIFQIDRHIREQMTRNIRGIDMVVGAKGSPLQLILSAVYQIDAPTGNISWAEAQRVMKNRLIDFWIPLSYGDSYEGYRIVGTDHQYPNLYEATLISGKLWQKPFEVTVGSTVAQRLNLRVGDTFHGAHGFTDDGDIHEEHIYQVVGIFRHTNATLDQLILTSYESVWEMHHHHEDAGDDHDHEHDHEHAENESNQEITAILVGFRSPTGMIQIPRLINERTQMQAAVPAYEIDRLFGLMGVSIDVLSWIALVIMLVSGLSIFINLYNALEDRRFEMALMRTYGASRWQLLGLVLQEGLILTGVGLLLGLLAGRVGLLFMFNLLQSTYVYSVQAWGWFKEEWWLLAASIAIGLLASLIPAIQAFNLNISKTLADE